MNYIGKELEIFQHATIWKKYYSRFLLPFLKGKIAEVGAGIGSTTSHLCNGSQESWLCIEPDPGLYQELERKINSGQLPPICASFKGILQNLNVRQQFNAILYIDVLEHIENDAAELNRGKEHLVQNGYLIVLVPAHQFLFSPFDNAVGHYRRYNKKTLKKISPNGMQLLSLRYLDSVGFFASAINRMLLKQKNPTQTQIKIWDKILVPLSKITDLLTRYNAGKTLIAIWQKKSDECNKQQSAD